MVDCLAVCLFWFLAKSKLSANVNGSYGRHLDQDLCRQQSRGHLGVLMLQ